MKVKFASGILAAWALSACAQPEPTFPSRVQSIGSPPSNPPSNPPTGSATVWIWVMVVDPSGACIPGATVQVVAGQAVGNPITQQTPCSVWDYAGGVEYHDLAAGVSMTLRATAPGYEAEERTITPFGGPQSVIDITLR
jgi:hypothetical protein